MMIKEGDILELKNGGFCRIVKRYFTFDSYPDGEKVKIRVIKPCTGACSKKSRVGESYTYQYDCLLFNLEKRIKRRVGAEEILELLFKAKKNGK